MRRMQLAQKSSSDTALIKDEIQDLLREGAIKRDGGCILRHYPETGECGGYRNDGEVSISRHLRDILSSPIMINNERIVANMSNTLLMTGVPLSLCD